MEPLIWKILAWTPILQVAVLSLGTLVSFSVAISQKHVSIYLPFISENGAILPEMGIFSSTLIFGSFIGVLTVCYRYLIVEHMLDEKNIVNTRLRQLNQLTCLSGLGSMAGLAGVAAFPMSTILLVHLIVAGVHFSLAMAYLFMNTYLSYRLRSSGDSPILMKMRLVLCIVLTIFLFLLVVCFPFGYVKWNKIHPEKKEALKVPDDEGFGLLFASAWFEWLLYSSFLTYILTFRVEFRHYEFVCRVQRVGGSKDTCNGSSSIPTLP